MIKPPIQQVDPDKILVLRNSDHQLSFANPDKLSSLSYQDMKDLRLFSIDVIINTLREKIKEIVNSAEPTKKIGKAHLAFLEEKTLLEHFLSFLKDVIFAFIKIMIEKVIKDKIKVEWNDRLLSQGIFWEELSTLIHEKLENFDSLKTKYRKMMKTIEKNCIENKIVKKKETFDKEHAIEFILGLLSFVKEALSDSILLQIKNASNFRRFKPIIATKFYLSKVHPCKYKRKYMGWEFNYENYRDERHMISNSCAYKFLRYRGDIYFEEVDLNSWGSYKYYYFAIKRIQGLTRIRWLNDDFDQNPENAIVEKRMIKLLRLIAIHRDVENFIVVGLHFPIENVRRLFPSMLYYRRLEQISFVVKSHPKALVPMESMKKYMPNLKRFGFTLSYIAYHSVQEFQDHMTLWNSLYSCERVTFSFEVPPFDAWNNRYTEIFFESLPANPVRAMFLVFDKRSIIDCDLFRVALPKLVNLEYFRFVIALMDGYTSLKVNFEYPPSLKTFILACEYDTATPILAELHRLPGLQDIQITLSPQLKMTKETKAIAHIFTQNRENTFDIVQLSMPLDNHLLKSIPLIKANYLRLFFSRIEDKTNVENFKLNPELKEVDIISPKIAKFLQIKNVWTTLLNLEKLSIRLTFLACAGYSIEDIVAKFFRSLKRLPKLQRLIFNCDIFLNTILRNSDIFTSRDRIKVAIKWN